MKKIIVLLFTLVTVAVSVNARTSNGCYSDAQRGGFNHDRTCRVVSGYSYCTDYSGFYFQLSPGMSIAPNMGFEGAFGFGRKFSSGMTLGLNLRGGYVGTPLAAAGISTTYEFTALRKYTDIFYPVLGAEFGAYGKQVSGEKNWNVLPYVGYKAGFRFACVRGRFDIGFEYIGNYSFAVKGLTKDVSNSLTHSVAITLCAYIPNYSN